MEIKNIERKDARSGKYGLSYYVDGNRRRRYFRTEAHREAGRDELLRNLASMGGAGVSISPEDVIMLKRCRELLGPDVSLIEACLEYSANRKSYSSIDILTAADLFANRRIKLGISSARIRSGDAVFTNLQGGFGCDVSEITESALSEWILSLPFEPETKRSYRNHLKSFFEFCADQGWCGPMDFKRVAKGMQVPEKEAVILSIAQIKKLMAHAWDQHPVCCGYFALSLFAGIRSSAVARLKWEDINFKDRGILMIAENSKTTKRHYVDGFPDVTWAWLEAIQKRVGRDAYDITLKDWQVRRSKIAEECKVPIPRNALRKSFASYMVAATGDASKVATLMTHRNPSKLYETYKGNARRAEGAAFLKIMPKV